MESPHPNPLAETTGAESTPVRVDVAHILRQARRGIWSARLARFGIFCLGMAGFVLVKEPTLPFGMGLLFGTAAACVVLISKTAKNQQDLMRVPAWIDAGEFTLADSAITRSLARFSIAVRPRLQALWSLAMSMSAQGCPVEARQVAEAALRYRQPKQVADALRLIAAAGALATNDLNAAHAALSAIVTPLSLRDSLKLLELQTDYCVRVAAWQHAIHDLPSKVEMAELLPANASAAVQAMLALAARRVGQASWCDWLVRRAALLTDVAVLVQNRPALAELFPVPSADIQQNDTSAFV